jgi:hypothetical protein
MQIGGKRLGLMAFGFSIVMQGTQLAYFMTYHTDEVSKMEALVNNVGILPARTPPSQRANQTEVYRLCFNKSKLLHAWKNLEYNTQVRIPQVIHSNRRTDLIKHNDNAVTVAVHASTQRLNRLLFLIERWGGPVSASIYMTSQKDIETLEKFYVRHAESFKYTDIHILMENTNDGYPHNILRNMALKSIQSDYFLALDVDFVTTPNASQSLHDMIRSDIVLQRELQNKTLMVLPAFNRNLRIKINETNVFEIGTKSLPKSKEVAMKDWDVGHIEPFHVKKFSRGHASTDFDKWYDGDNTTKSFYKIHYKLGFEPYVLGYNKRGDVELPDYWEGFRGFGYNKYTWFQEAHRMGFRFGVLKDYFVTHLDHKYGKRKIANETEEQLEYFNHYIHEKYGPPWKPKRVPAH